MADRNFGIVSTVEDTAVANYPLNKESAEILRDMTNHPGWFIFLKCLEYEAGIYKDAALATGYGPTALEKFRFNQALAVNLPRIPRAILEAVDIVLADQNNLNAIYDELHLNKF